MFDRDRIKTETVNDSDSEKHIVFGVDRNYIPHAIVAITSLMKNAHDSTFHFHIIVPCANFHYINLLRDFFKPLRHGLSVHYIDENLLNNLPSTDRFSLVTYYRLLAPIILSEAEKVLYLDADIICINAISELWEMEFGQNDIALVVKDIEHLQSELAKEACLNGGKYFNSGMMFIDVKRWNNNKISARTLSLLLASAHKFKFPDQDALNKILENSVAFIDRKFNNIVMLEHDKNGYATDVPEQTCIIHYTGSDKPWQVWNRQRVCQHYINALGYSPIVNYCFDTPVIPEQAKKLYKLYFRSGKFARGIWWRLKYYKMRYF